MRTFGRVYNDDGTYTWVEVDTDINGHNDAVYATTLCQCLQLVLGESPFYANYGIPAQQSVVQQVFPDYNMHLTQQQFAPYFANLQITRQPNQVGTGRTPVYLVNIITSSGAKLITEVSQ
jgi:hypothetical protein